MTAPTKPQGSDSFTGLAASLTSAGISPTLRGGTDGAFTGESGRSVSTQPPAEQAPFAGMGVFLEAPDAKVFKMLDELVRRQELIAQNQMQIDAHWLWTVAGYGLFTSLKKDPGKDMYQQSLLYGSRAIEMMPVPNKSRDLVRKATSTILSDFPEIECEPLTDSEEASNACDLANRFLVQDSSEQGTNDAVLWNDRVERALATGSSYIEYWVDPVAGGYVPFQIEAHPNAESPLTPLVDAQGVPTTDYPMRYVTGPLNPDGSPSGQSQFTDDPSEAAPQWQPKIMAQKWGNEHIRCFPETATVDTAEKVIVLGYCTLGTAKRRWKSVASMNPDDLGRLCDWTPTRYLPLLPPFQRARWKLTDGGKEKGGSSDERIMFYYHVQAKASPDYPKGCAVVATGAFDGRVLDRQLLAATVEVDKGQGKTKEVRCMEIRLVQITPIGDPYEQNPRGRAFVELFAGAAANNAYLALSFSEILEKIATQPFAIPVSSPLEGWQVEDARASGDFLIVNSKQDFPQQLTPPVLPSQTLEFYEKSDEAINSIAAQERAANGADNSKERSGKALQIAVNQNNVANTGMQTAVLNAYARGSRIKLELVTAFFSTTQQIAYTGEDGSYKQDDFSAVDFALVGKATIKAGTGTMMTPDAKVQYLGNLKAAGLVEDGEVAEAARPAFSKRLGLPPNSHEQYVERCLDSWLKGPPAPKQPQIGTPPLPSLEAGVVGSIPQAASPQTWEQEWSTYYAAKQQADQAQAQYQQQGQAYQLYLHNAALVAGGPPPEKLGPESQNAQAMTSYQMAVEAMQMGQQQALQAGQPWPPQPPVAPQIQLPPEPWQPFVDRPNDAEPLLATIWQRKLSKAMSTVKYATFRDTSPGWAQTLDLKYAKVVQTLQQVQQQHAPQPQAKAQP